MNLKRISLRTMILLSLLVLFASTYLYERNRADQLQKKLDAVLAPVKQEIEATQSTIAKRRLAINFMQDSFANQTSVSQGSAAVIGNLQLAGQRAELANLRNAKLKLLRDEAKLQSLEQRLKEVEAGE